MTGKKTGGTLPKNEKSFALKTVIQKPDLKKHGLIADFWKVLKLSLHYLVNKTELTIVFIDKN